MSSIGQRTGAQTTGTAFPSQPADGTRGYDALGQVTRADSPVNASDRAYEYDQIGNRKKTATGSLTLPAGDNWVANALNQYTTANGVAMPTAPFDLDGNMTAGPVPGANGNMPGVQPAANATDIKWDAEQSDRRGRILDEGEAEARRVSHAMPRMTNQNRLVSITIGTTTYGYTYDHLSRLITRRTGTTVNGRYNYDGWNRIVDYGTSTTSPLNSYTWGLDLSGTLQGAGGVGGLLATRWGTSAHFFPTYDGNGNVSEYLASNGGVIVHYEYDPFGNLTRLTGSTHTRFAYRFSTKPRDAATGLYYYGYRWFDPYTGRWPSRDPIEESGGVNLYGFVGNQGVSRADLLGLCTRADIEVTGQNVKITPNAGEAYDIGRESLVGLMGDLLKDVTLEFAGAFLSGYFEGRSNIKGVERGRDLTETVDKVKKKNAPNNLPLLTGAAQVLISTGGLFKFELTIYAKCCKCQPSGNWEYGEEFQKSRVVKSEGRFECGGPGADDVYWDFRNNLKDKALYRTLSNAMVRTWQGIAKEIVNEYGKEGIRK